LIPTVGPVFPFILWNRGSGDRRSVGADDRRRGTGLHGIIAIAHRQICAPVAYGQRGPPTVRRHVDSIVPLIEQRNDAGRRVDFVDLAGTQVPHVYVDRAFVDPDLRYGVADLAKVQGCQWSDPHC
jgi:hypothetical protein